jgi:signal transduction histidine kinase
MNETGIITFRPTEQAPHSASSRALARLYGPGCDTLAALAHDARNLITALNLYCDLLNEPGVLSQPFSHYGNELRLVAAAGRSLVAKLLASAEFEPGAAPTEVPKTHAVTQAGNSSADLLALPRPAATRNRTQRRFDDEFAATPITNLAAELLANRNLLSALAGPGIALTVDVEGGARGIGLNAEDLTRILVNLVRNSAEAMSQSPTNSGGRIHISLTEIGLTGIGPVGQSLLAGVPACLRLVIEDNGPGISAELIDKVFDRGFTTHAAGPGCESWTNLHRGLGLAITRSIIESACGRIQVANRPGGGARFSIELPAL